MCENTSSICFYITNRASLCHYFCVVLSSPILPFSSVNILPPPLSLNISLHLYLSVPSSPRPTERWDTLKWRLLGFVLEVTKDDQRVRVTVQMNERLNKISVLTEFKIKMKQNVTL